MNKIHRPHRLSGYIAKVDFQQTADNDGQPDWIMFYMPGPKARAEYRVFAKRGGPNVLEIEPPDSPPRPVLSELSELESELIQRGVTQATAAELVRNHAEEKIRAQIERLDWIVSKKPQKIDDLAAYLVDAVRKDFAAPKGFVSKAEHHRRDEAKRQADQQAAVTRRRKQMEEARQQEARRTADAHLQSLSPEGRAALEETVLAQVSPEARQNYENPIMARHRSMLMLAMLREYLGSRLTLRDLPSGEA
jgi:hypothetical protein